MKIKLYDFSKLTNEELIQEVHSLNKMKVRGTSWFWLMPPQESAYLKVSAILIEIINRLPKDKDGR